MRVLLLLSAAVCALSLALEDDCAGCQAYDCFEDNVRCGADSYLIKYGGKYCRKFNQPETLKKFSPAGQDFLHCTTSCLKVFMKDYITAKSYESPFSKSQCAALSSDAFGSHVKCYLDCNFCSICKTEKAALFSIYEFRDFLSWNAVKQIYQVMRACGGPHTCFDLF